MSYQPLIAPSILSADFARLDREIERIPSADWIHVDVMDGHFVPNLSFGAPVAKAVGRVTDKPMDCHLMITDPDRWAPSYAEAGARNVTVHVEAASDPVQVARAIRSAPTPWLKSSFGNSPEVRSAAYRSRASGP